MIFVRAAWGLPAVIAGVTVALCALSPRPLPSIHILSPRNLSVHHESSIDLAYFVGGILPAGAVVQVVVNGTAALRTSKYNPTIQLAGLNPGVCEFVVEVLDFLERPVGARDTAMILITSAFLRNWTAPDDEDLGGPWQAVAFSSDDWGRTADMIPLFADKEALDHAVAEGWDPGSWGRATVETADDVRRLFDMLDDLNAPTLALTHQRIVVSPYWVVGGPAYDLMAQRGCPSGPGCGYEERRIDNSEGAAAYWPFLRGDLRELYRSGLDRGLWHPGLLIPRPRLFSQLLVLRQAPPAHPPTRGPRFSRGRRTVYRAICALNPRLIRMGGWSLQCMRPSADSLDSR